MHETQTQPMTTVLIRAEVAPEHVVDVEAAAADVFTALEAAKPEGLQYAAMRLDDGVTYVILLSTPEGGKNPLLSLPEYQQFVKGLREWLAGPSTTETLTLLGSYRLF